MTSLAADGRLAVVGTGAVGARVVRQLAPEVAAVLVHDIDTVSAAAAPGESVPLHEVNTASVVVLATPSPQAPLAADLLAQGCSVVTTSDDLADVVELLDLHQVARSSGARIVVGAAMSPGLSGLLMRHLMAGIDEADEVHVAVHGTGGPACAHQHHRALGGRAVGWRDGSWFQRTAGSGRELCWFPEPIGARDCYRAEMADPILLQRVAPELQRISARMSATRRDRLTARLPMLSPPHREGGIGALRLEVRGRQGIERHTVIAGTSERAAVVSAAVAATMAMLLVPGALPDLLVDDLPEGAIVCGDPALPTAALLASVIRRGISLQEFAGADHLTDW